MKKNLLLKQSLGKATKYLPINIKKHDHPGCKKPKTARAAPDVHIAVNITPAPGPTMVDGSYMVSKTVQHIPVFSASPGPYPENISNAPAHPATHQPHDTSTRRPRSAFLLILDCLHEQRVPTVLELLALMDKDDPVCDLKYVDVHSELSDHGIKDIIHINSLPVELLATMGCLGLGGATSIQDYAREKLLWPLGLLETRARAAGEAVPPGNDDDDDSSVVEVTREVAVKQEEEVVVVEQEVTVKQEAVVKQESASNQLVATQNNDDDDEPFQSIPLPQDGRRRYAILQWLKGLPVSWEGMDVSSVDGLWDDSDDSGEAVGGGDAASQEV
jgi:hypothetical protein